MNIKALLLKGKNHFEDSGVIFEIEGQKINPRIRPLTDMEATEVQSALMSGLDTELVKSLVGRNLSGNEASAMSELLDGMSKDGLVGMFKNNMKAAYLTCSYGIVNEDGEQFTPEEIGMFPPGIPAQIAEKIRKISGLDDEAEGIMSGFRS